MNAERRLKCAAFQTKYLWHFRIFCEGYVECLRGCAFRQQLCHDHQPLIAGVFFIIFPAAGGKGQNGIFLGECYVLDIQPVFPRNRFKEAGEIISRWIGRNIIEFNIRDEQRSDLKKSYPRRQPRNRYTGSPAQNLRPYSDRAW